jgi:co-chaperonin GroES (HSP10)
MKVLHDNVLVTEDTQKETTTAAGLILTTDITSGNKPARVIAFGDELVESGLYPDAKVYLKWSEAMPVELDGLKCGVVKYEHIKLIVD